MIKEKKKSSLKVVLSVVFILIVLAVCALAPVLAKHDPTEIDLLNKFISSSGEYPMGTDDYGRCIFCRCLYAVRYSVGIAVCIEFISVLIGTVIGMTAGYFGGIYDRCINIISEALISFPNLILVMLIVAFLGPSTQNIIIAMLLVNWIWYTRVARGLTLSTKEPKYVQAAKLCGAGSASIIARHIFPRIASQMIVQFTISLGSVILSLAGFSFIGIGVQRPTPELGVMISDACGLIRTHFTVLFWPSLVLFLIVLAFNILGDYIGDKLREND